MAERQFIHLHLHSEYSLLDGACKAKEIPKRAKEMGMSAVAVTDHGNLHGAIEFYKACLDEGVKPIIGIEAYVCEHDRHEKRDAKPHTGHMILLARNLQGYRNLLKLASEASLDGFYYRPRVDHELLGKYREGIIALSACIGGEIPKLIRTGDLEQAKTLCCMYQEFYGPDGFYLEIQDHNTPAKLIYADQPIVNAKLRELGRELGIPLVATNDTHFMHKDDYDAHEVLVCIGKQTTVEEHRAKGMSYSTEHYMKNAAEMYATFPEYHDALENSVRIAELCNLELELDNPQLPQYDVPAGETWDSHLRKLCEVRLAEIYQSDEAARTVASERLNYELGIIANKGLSAYFLIVKDFLDWSREQGILVGIRGSGAGAIVAYLTGISTLDPIEYGLWFERFLSLDRASMPDIDCDFEDRRRGEVIDYVVNKYGADKVAQVATFGTLQPRLAVRDAARAMGIPLSTADRVSKAIGSAKTIEDAIADSTQMREMCDADPTVKRLLDMAAKLQGLTRHVGTHACALVISKDRLDETAPLQRSPGDNNGVQTQWEYPMAEAAGLVKMDFLGLRTLTVLKDALIFVEKYHGVSLNLATLPLDDAKAYELCARGNTAGVFQLESEGMRNALRQLRPDRITDVIAMVALYRPGPMAEIPKFCAGKHDPSTITYLHPSLEPILRETYGVLVYQEQVMAIGRDIAGLSVSDANDLLTALRKKKLDKMAKLEPYFLEGLKKTSQFNNDQAEALWDRLKEFAKYAFNKAHSACYAIVAYQTAYLKANYPVEFMTALLTSVSDSHDKISLYKEECRKLGVAVLPPDVNRSFVGFTIEDGQIRFGMSAIKGVGAGAVDAIVKSREADGEFADLFDFCARVESGQCNRLALEALVKCGAFDKLPGNRAQKLAVLDDAMEMGQSSARDKAVGQVNLFGDIATEAQQMIPELPNLPEYPTKQLNDMEREYLGLYISNHPLNEHAEILGEFRTASVEELSEPTNTGGDEIIGGMLTQVKPYVTKKGDTMGFLVLDDLTGTMEVTAFSDVYQKYLPYLQQDSIVLIKGTVEYGQQNPTRAQVQTDEDDETHEAEKQIPKMLAISFSPVDDMNAIDEMRHAVARRRGGPNGNYKNGNGNGNGNSPAPVNLNYYQRPERNAPREFVPEEVIMENTTEEKPAIYQLYVSAEFVKSDGFESFSNLLRSCPGTTPVEIALRTPTGVRRWRLENINVNPTQFAPYIKMLDGVSLEG